MAETWAVLLLLLPLFNPLLSGHLPTLGETGNNSTSGFNLTEEVRQPTPSSTTLIQDRGDDTFTTVATRESNNLTETEATTETETMATTTADYEDLSWSADQDNTHVTGNQQPTSRQSAAHSTFAEAETAETTTEVTSQGSTRSWHETYTASRMAKDSAEATDTHPTENIATTKPRPETSHPAAAAETVETSSTSTQHPGPSTSAPVGMTDGTSGPLSTTNSTMGALVPRMDPGGRHPGTDPPEIKPDRVPADKGGFPCVTPTSWKDGLVSQCLIAIAALAGVATIFIVSTTVLCTKLSTSKYRYRMNQAYGTEMVCISALLPDGNGTHGRPRIPKSNGALIPNAEDVEGDDLTLHSFLPESDRGS